MELSMALQGRGGPAVSGDRGRSFDPMPMNHYLPPPDASASLAARGVEARLPPRSHPPAD